MSAPLFHGGYEDLVQLVLRLEQRALERDKVVLPAKPRWKRRLIELPLNLAAGGYSGFLKLLPPVVAERFFLMMFDVLTGKQYQAVGKSISESHESASIIYTFIKYKYSEPALLCLTSHPPVLGEIRDLNLGLMGAGFRLMRAVHGTGRRFRILLAVDVMALDTLFVSEEAIYAGAMSVYHLSMDRLPSSRMPIQRLLFGRYTYHSIAWRLADALRRRHNVVMIPAGGVGETARILYTCRELVWRLRQKTPKRPWNVVGVLRAADPEFSAFLGNFSEGGSAWRRLEAYLAARLARDPLAGDFSREKSEPITAGVLEDSDRSKLLMVFSAFGIPPAGHAQLLADFEQEFKRISPYRYRLFRLIMRRVIHRGVPVLILPLDYSLEPHAPILQREPLALVPGANGTVEAVSLRDGAPHLTSKVDEAFFIAWGQATFAA